MTTQLKNLEITEREQADFVNGNGLVHQPSSLLEIISQAVAQKADIATLERLWALKLQVDANEAKNAFVRAMNAFKANAPTIRKNKHVAFGQTEYDHATLDHVCDEVTQSLSKHGISHRWDVEQKDARIKVTCVLTHELGHSERTALEGPADTSGSKNAIQAIASAVTYLERYTLLAATGLAPKNGDDDGHGSNAPQGLPETTVTEYTDYLREAHNREDLQHRFQEAYQKATAAKDKKSGDYFIALKDQLRKGLR